MVFVKNIRAEGKIVIMDKSKKQFLLIISVFYTDVWNLIKKEAPTVGAS